jgi:hypothetical protein
VAIKKGVIPEHVLITDLAVCAVDKVARSLGAYQYRSLIDDSAAFDYNNLPTRKSRSKCSHVLIYQDHDAARELVWKQIQEWGFAVKEGGSGWVGMLTRGHWRWCSELFWWF